MVRLVEVEPAFFREKIKVKGKLFREL